MRGTTRFTVGIFAASIAAPGLGAGLLVAAGAMLPDIDTPTSKISHQASAIPSLFLEHRGITHSLFFAAASTLISPWLSLGILTHIALDILNAAGVRLFWPHKKRISLRRIRTGSLLDYVLCGLFLLLGITGLSFRMHILSPDMLRQLFVIA